MTPFEAAATGGLVCRPDPLRRTLARRTAAERPAAGEAVPSFANHHDGGDERTAPPSPGGPATRRGDLRN